MGRQAIRNLGEAVAGSADAVLGLIRHHALVGSIRVRIPMKTYGKYDWLLMSAGPVTD